jgi:prepilin peptidase CpaA
MDAFLNTLAENWQQWGYWAVAVFAIVAAYIDGKELRVPNKLTFPMIIAGWVFSMILWEIQGDAWYNGLLWSLAGTFIGGLTLLPFYAIGGMGAGDVKMMAGIGAWVHVMCIVNSFLVGAVVGGVIAVVMVLMAGEWRKHYNQFFYIFNEIVTVKNPEKLSEIAGERKSSMRLLPYGIPMAIGTLMYMGWNGMLA